MDSLEVTFDEDSISISTYPFRPGRAQSPLRISTQQIHEVDVNHCVLRVGDELVYLPGWPRDALKAFCDKHLLPSCPRYQVWSDILAPYVDSSFTSKQKDERRQRLEAAGLGWARTLKLRLLVAIPMIVYQGIAGEWTGLYVYDLMQSLRFLRALGLYGMVYKAIMKVALEPYGQP